MTITYTDFQKLEIRVGTIIIAEKISGADKLLRLVIDLGNEKRQIIAGIAQDYKPSQLVNRQVPVLVNLEPRKLRGLESQGMLLAVDYLDKAVLLKPSKKIANGSLVR